MYCNYTNVTVQLHAVGTLYTCTCMSDCKILFECCGVDMLLYIVCSSLLGKYSTDTFEASHDTMYVF